MVRAALLGENKQALILFGMLLFSVLAASGCGASPAPAAGDVSVDLIDESTTISLSVPIGSSVQSVLEKAGLTLSPLDRTEPPSFTLVTEPMTIKIIRVVEEYEVEEIVIPFEHQTVRNESLPEGETLLIQAGENGLQRITYRTVLENGVQTSRTVFEVVNVREARPEIMMIGAQALFTPVEIQGRLVFLLAGNAWMMENSTANRRPVLTTGDLDGRVFSLSPDGSWLLCTRSSGMNENEINTLWAVNLSSRETDPIDLQTSNIIHYAGWDPDGGLAIYYSSVEPRSTAPGWQANNDLIRLSFTANGTIESRETILAANSGGVYGWWGTNFVWSPDGDRLAYARPDSVGLVDFEGKSTRTLIELIPYQTGGDWAWVPGLSWSSDSQLLYTVTHAPLEEAHRQELSPLFQFSAYVMDQGPVVDLLPQAGMFAYPVASPYNPSSPGLVALLQAVFPEQSDSSRYRLVLMDQDGSNPRVLYPPEGAAGLDPQQVVWSPPVNGSAGEIAFIHQGNIWLIDPEAGNLQQITGDGLITRLDWQ